MMILKVQILLNLSLNRLVLKFYQIRKFLNTCAKVQQPFLVDAMFVCVGPEVSALLPALGAVC